MSHFTISRDKEKLDVYRELKIPFLSNESLSCPVSIKACCLSILREIYSSVRCLLEFPATENWIVITPRKIYLLCFLLAHVFVSLSTYIGSLSRINYMDTLLTPSIKYHSIMRLNGKNQQCGVALLIVGKTGKNCNNCSLIHDQNTDSQSK